MHIMKNGVFWPNALPNELPGLTQALAGQFGSDAPGPLCLLGINIQMIKLS